MHFIAHRGNISGRKIERENSIGYIEEALQAGYDCEIDVWYIDNELFLGHDNPQYNVSEIFLRNHADKLWLHCKNIDALINLQSLNAGFNCFFHDKDMYTLTTKGYIWGNINSKLTKEVVCVMPERYSETIAFEILHHCKGICSDYIQKYKQSVY